MEKKHYPVMTRCVNPAASTNFTLKPYDPVFGKDSYSYGALLGYLSNINNYIKKDIKITAESSLAEYNKYGITEFCGVFNDHYDLHRLLLWKGKGVIIFSDRFRTFADSFGISFSNNVINDPSKKKAYCTPYIENLLIVWNFVAKKEFNSTAISIYPQGDPTSAIALKNIFSSSFAKSDGTVDPLNPISKDDDRCTDSYPVFNKHIDEYNTDNIVFSDEMVDDPDFIRGFTDGFDYY